MQALTVTTNVQEIAQLANQYAASNAFLDYQERLAENTRKRHLSDLKVFASFLSQVGIMVTADELFNDPTSWQYITHGLITARAFHLKIQSVRPRKTGNTKRLPNLLVGRADQDSAR